MNEKFIREMQAQLVARLHEISRENAETLANRATVTLDQQTVGRLSRMDAMQQQAMANATHQRRQQEITRIKAAQRRMVDGEYGYCLDCGDEIAVKRLEFDPTAAKCITCARG